MPCDGCNDEPICDHVEHDPEIGQVKNAYTKKPEEYTGPKVYASFDLRPQPFERSYEDKSIIKRVIDYQLNRVDDEPWQYVGGNMVSVHIRPLSQGLLGYTDTRTSIHLTTPDLCKPFDINPREVDFHEKNHFGCWDEYENRRQVEVNRHLWDLGELPPLEQPEEMPFYRVEKDNSSVSYTVYQG